jgi:hypothetical protein
MQNSARCAVVAHKLIARFDFLHTLGAAVVQEQQSALAPAKRNRNESKEKRGMRKIVATARGVVLFLPFAAAWNATEFLQREHAKRS